MTAVIVCPLCRLPLERQAKIWRCAANHSFDVAREGYVNLLPVQHKHSREPGDRPDMVMARREFLDGGHYEPLCAAVVEMLTPFRPETLLDIGCGEGYYTSALSAVASTETIGLDIAKPAIQLAAKRHRDRIIWLVGSGAVLPIADGAIDIVTSLFTPLHVAEIQRVLKPGGHLLIATPAADHLWSLREGLFDEVRAHEPDKFIAEFEAGRLFELGERRELRFDLSLTQRTLKQLLMMTPYVWKARLEKRAALESNASFETRAAILLMLFCKR